MRLVRGSGWPGLGGMKAVDPARRLLRPLLGTPRAELEAFLRSLGVDWIEDASNRSDAFRRNRMRNHVIPLLKAENPSFSRSTRTLWELAREDEHYWNEVLAPVFAQLREENGSLLLPRAAFVSLPRAARLRVYAGLFHRFGRGQAQSETLFRLDEAAVSSRSRKVFQFPGGVCITTDGDGVLMKTGGGGRTPSERTEPSPLSTPIYLFFFHQRLQCQIDASSSRPRRWRSWACVPCSTKASGRPMRLMRCPRRFRCRRGVPARRKKNLRQGVFLGEQYAVETGYQIEKLLFRQRLDPAASNTATLRPVW